MKNFREASELILKNIYVTDELKRKTIEKCTNRKILIKKPVLTATLSVASIVFFGIFIYFFHKPAVTSNNIAKAINQEYKNSSNNEEKIQEAPKTTARSDSNKSPSAASNSKNNIKENVAAPHKKNADIAMKDSKNVPQNKSTDAVNANTETASKSRNDSSKISYSAPQDSAYISNSNSDSNSSSNSDSNSSNNSSKINDNSNSKINPAAQVHPSLASVPETLTVEKAEKYFESKILLPSFIPEGFKLTDISIPDDKQKCIKLEYSSDSADFEILQSKSLSKLAGTENISIGNNTAYINSIKDEKTNITTTNITWIEDNVQYCLTSSLPEDSLIKIAKSVN